MRQSRGAASVGFGDEGPGSLWRLASGQSGLGPRLRPLSADEDDDDDGDDDDGDGDADGNLPCGFHEQ